MEEVKIFVTILYITGWYITFIGQMWAKALDKIEYSYFKLLVNSTIWPYFLLFG